MRLKFKHFIPGIAWFFLVVVLMFLPGSDLPETETWIQLLYVDKILHAGIFGLLFFFFYYPIFKSDLSSLQIRKLLYITILFSITMGGISEIVQSYIPGRSSDWVDWVADAAGVIITYILFPLLIKVIAR